MKRLIFILLFVIGPIIYCQDELKFPVELSHSGNDLVGSRLAFTIKERIRKSESMRITYEDELRVTLILITLDQYNDSPGTSSCYSFVICWENPEMPLKFYVTSFVGYCGSSRVDEVAENLVSETDKNIEDFLRLASQANSD